MTNNKKAPISVILMAMLLVLFTGSVNEYCKANLSFKSEVCNIAVYKLYRVNDSGIDVLADGMELPIIDFKSIVLYSQMDGTKPYYEVTSDERELLARLVHEEGNIESEECQRAIASVVFNRRDGGIFGGERIYDVIYADSPLQFTVSPLLKNTVPNETNYSAVDYVVQNGPTLPYYVCFFRSQHYFSNLVDYCNIDHTYFSYKQSHIDALSAKIKE